jgi:leucine dehydrogenase
MVRTFKHHTAVNASPEFDNHIFISFLNDAGSGLRGYIALHRKNGNTPLFGATRIWHYDTDLEALEDALRLSRMMSYKSALAGLKYGGAKGVIILNSKVLDRKSRNKLLETYAEYVNRLNGQFITGTDVGLTQKDLDVMSKRSKYIVGFNGNSTEFTALGVYYSIQTCLEKVFGTNDMKDRSFAVQGLGKIGKSIIELIYRDAKIIFVSDTDKEEVNMVKKKFPAVRAVNPRKIHKQKVDVYCPCALSHAINSESVADLSCRIIAGGANNQLEDEKIGELLHRLGILYAPDYVVNAGGLISVVDEFENKTYSRERVARKVRNIQNTLSRIFRLSEKQNKAPNIIANEIAEKIISRFK